MTLEQALGAGVGVVRLPEWQGRQVLVLPPMVLGQMIPWGMLSQPGGGKPESVALRPLMGSREDRYEVCRDLVW